MPTLIKKLGMPIAYIEDYIDKRNINDEFQQVRYPTKVFNDKYWICETLSCVSEDVVIGYKLYTINENGIIVCIFNDQTYEKVKAELRAIVEPLKLTWKHR